MESHLERVEVEPTRRGDHDLAIHHRPPGQTGQKGGVQLGKVAVERPQVAALNEHVVRAAKDDRPEPVPFRLVEKGVAGGELCGELGEHRLDWRRDRKRVRRHVSNECQDGTISADLPPLSTPAS